MKGNETMERMKKLIDLKDNVGKKASLDCFSSFSLQLDAENELILTGRCLLRSFSDTVITAEISMRKITVSGRGMYVTVFSDHELSVHGEIDSIVFEKGGKQIGEKMEG